MDPKKRDRNQEDNEMYQARRAARLESLITAAVIIATAIALGVSVWALIETFLRPLIDALGGG